jgi:hypothetical protein
MNFYCFKPQSFVVICYNSNSKLTHTSLPETVGEKLLEKTGMYWEENSKFDHQAKKVGRIS